MLKGGLFQILLNKYDDVISRRAKGFFLDGGTYPSSHPLDKSININPIYGAITI